MEVGFAEVGAAESSSVKISLAEVGSAEIDSAVGNKDEIGIAEVGLTEVWLDISMLLPPLVPYLHPLIKDVKMLLVCHVVYLLKRGYSS